MGTNEANCRAVARPVWRLKIVRSIDTGGRGGEGKLVAAATFAMDGARGADGRAGDWGKDRGTWVWIGRRVGTIAKTIIHAAGVAAAHRIVAGIVEQIALAALGVLAEKAL